MVEGMKLPYIPGAQEEDSAAPELASMATLAFTFFGMVMKVKYAIWAALFFAISSFMNLTVNNDTTSAFMLFMFVGMALFTTYRPFVPNIMGG